MTVKITYLGRTTLNVHGFRPKSWIAGAENRSRRRDRARFQRRSSTTTDCLCPPIRLILSDRSCSSKLSGNLIQGVAARPRTHRVLGSLTSEKGHSECLRLISRRDVRSIADTACDERVGWNRSQSEPQPITTGSDISLIPQRAADASPDDRPTQPPAIDPIGNGVGGPSMSVGHPATVQKSLMAVYHAGSGISEDGHRA